MKIFNIKEKFAILSKNCEFFSYAVSTAEVI
jgi:hypothetical protein